ncbi:MAG: hypothetical protein J5833_03410 [Victivallales bacterium]|nr:hypothetical protein [Victivallales bacterium]
MKTVCTVLFALAVFVMSGCGFTDSSQSVNDAYNAAKRGEWDKVKAATERRLKEVPTDNDAAALLSLALFYSERENPESMNRAMNYIRQAVTAMPERYDLAFVYGWMLLNSGRSPEAKKPLQDAYDMHLNDKNSIGQETQGSIKYALGLCCLRNNTFDDAEKYLTQSVKSTPYASWSRLYSDIACSLVYRQKFKDALSFLNKAMEVEKSRAALRAKLIEEYNRMKASNATEAALEKKKKEIDELAPDECMYVTYLNMAIVCDYLSYSTFNAENPADFRASVPAWYAFAKKSIMDAKKNTKSAKEQVEFNRLVANIDRRVALLTRK